MAFDFSKYSKIQELLQQSNLYDKTDQIIWTRLNREEAAIYMAEMLLMAKAALTNNINLRKRSKIAANYYYDVVGNQIHGFARGQAISDLKLSPEEAVNVFPLKSLKTQLGLQTNLNI